MNNNLSTEELKRQDDGRIINCQKIYLDRSVEDPKYFVTLNIFPYQPREIDYDTFSHFLQYCEDGRKYENFEADVIHYSAKHWSKL